MFPLSASSFALLLATSLRAVNADDFETFMQCIHYGHLDRVKELVKKGNFGLNCLFHSYGDSASPLQYALTRKQKDIALFLISLEKVNVSIRLPGREGGNSPLMIALKENLPECVEALLERNPTIGTIDDKWNNVYHQAVNCRPGGGRIIRLLTAKNPQYMINIPNNGGMTPLRKALLNLPEDDADALDMVKAMLEAGATTVEASRGNRDTLLHIITKPYLVPLFCQEANLTARNASGRTALLQACWEGRGEVMVAMLNNGANILDEDERGNCIFHSPVTTLWNDEFVEFLMEKGGKCLLNRKNGAGETPLTQALKQLGLKRFNPGEHHPGIYEAILKAGADPNAANDGGETPLTIAVRNNQYTVARWLVEWKADLEKETVSHLMGNQRPPYVTENEYWEFTRFLWERRMNRPSLN